MKISVITVSYNSAATIVETVESVLEQKGVELEYIIIDGGSSDNTIALLEPYRDRIAYCLSERDKGMYDAMNKGIAQASGDVVAILNSDDVYSGNYVLEKVIKQFEYSDTELVYGDLHYVAYDDLTKVVRNWVTGLYEKGEFRRGWHPPHPSFFVRRLVYERYGHFDFSLSIAADYEFMLRVMERHQLKSIYLPEVLVKMRIGGRSNVSIINIIKANLQCWKAWWMNNLGWSPIPVIRKPFTKLEQFKS